MLVGVNEYAIKHLGYVRQEQGPHQDEMEKCKKAM